MSSYDGDEEDWERGEVVSKMSPAELKHRVYSMRDVALVAALKQLDSASPEQRGLLLSSPWEREFACSLVASFTGELTWKQRRKARAIVTQAMMVLAARNELHKLTAAVAAWEMR